jgi:predicted acylesterase/phospholipase RssA/CRP-like cAMP-binding protein
MHPAARQALEESIVHAFAVAPDDAAAVLHALHPVMLGGGEWLFRQGDEGDSLFLLARGRLQVWIEAHNGDAGRPALVAEVGPGETVGEISLLTGGPRSASLRAVRDSLLLRMDAAAFDRLGRERPQIVRQIAGGIAARLRDRSVGNAGVRRGFRTMAVVPLDDGGRELARRLGEALAARAPTQLLTSASLATLGAPSLPESHHHEMSSGLTQWLADQEERHRFVLFLADQQDSAWSRLALRHADAVLWVARADGEPARRPLEESLAATGSDHGALHALVLQHEGQPSQLSGTDRWLAGRHLDHHFHVRDGVPGDFARLARILAGEAVGLVLGGGAARGFAHIGVYRALDEAGIPVDWVGGSSIGAVFGAPIAMGMPPKDVVDQSRRAFVGGRPFSDMTVPVLSLLRGRRMEQLISAHLQGLIEDLPIPFFCISSNLGRGVAHVHDHGSLVKAVRASVSLPGVFPPAVVDGQLAVDGGILDNLPVGPMQRQPVGKVIAVDVTSRQDYAVDYDTVPSPWSVLAGRLLPFAPRHRVPRFLSLMLKSAEIGTMAAVRAAGERADLLLHPPVSRFSLTDVRSFDEIVNVGYEHARRMLQDHWPGGPTR